jgi:uncharacterized protein (DUF1501 family)
MRKVEQMWNTESTEGKAANDDAAERSLTDRVEAAMDTTDQLLVLHLDGQRTRALIKAELIDHFRTEGGRLSVRGAIINNLATIRSLAAHKMACPSGDIELTVADLLGTKERSLSEILAESLDEAEGEKLDRLMQAIENAQMKAVR